MLNVDETAPSSSGHAVISDLPSVINVLHGHGSGSLHGGVGMPSVSVLSSDEEEESEDEIVGLVENDVIGHQSIDQMEGPIDFDEGLGSGSVATLLSEREMEGSAIIINEDEIIEPLRDKEGNLVITPLVHHNVVHLKEDIVGENLGAISVKEGEAAKDQSGTGVPAARNSFRNIFRPDLTHSRGSARCLQQKIVSSCISSGVSSLASDKIMELDEDAEPHAGVLPRHDSSETILNVAETEGVCYLPKRYIYQTGQEKSDSGGVTTCTKNGSGEKVAGPSDSDGKMAAPSELGGEVLEASTSGEKVAAPSESGGKVTSTSGSDVKTVISTGNDRETARTSTTDVEVTKTSSSNLKDTATRSALVEIACRDETITKTSITSPAETSSTSLKHGKSTSSGQKLIKSRSSGIKVTETSGTSLKDDKSTSRTKKVARTSSTGVKVADTSRTSVKGAKFSSSDVKVTKTASTGVKVGETSGISVKDAKSSTSDKKFVKTSSTGVKVTKTSSSGSKVAKTSGTSMKHARSSSSDKKVARTSSTGMKVAKTSSTSAKPAKSSSTGLKVKKTSQSGLKVAKSSSSGAKTTRSAQKVTEASSDHKQIAKTGSQVTETGSSAGKLSVSSGTSQKDTANAVSGSKIGDIPTSDTKVEDSHDAKSEKSTSVIETTETRGIHDRKDTDTTLSHTKSHSHPDVSQLEKLDTVTSDSDEEENVLRQIYSSHRHLRERPPSPIPSDDNIRRPSHQVFHHGSALLSPITSELSLTETDGPEGTVDSNVSVDSQSEPPLEAREGESAVETGEVAKTEEGSSLETHPEITQSSHLPPGTSDNTESGSQHSRLHSDSSLKDKEGAAS
ncbi:mucin-22-like [Ptychodera flava]|uniref:mucin-22-like n=1 Tax=Ptychodera flava TaxID=63121 RepID=UPI00396A9D04